MSEVSEMWKDQKKAQRKRRAKRLPKRSKAILDACDTLGLKVRKLTDYQYRVGEALDLYPTHRRYHDLSSGKRGSYRVEADFIARFFKQGEGE